MGDERERLKEGALGIFEAGLRAADPEEALRRRLSVVAGRLLLSMGDGPPHRTALPERGRVLLVGAGKASAAMARGMERVLGERIAEGVVLTKEGDPTRCGTVEVLEAGHPVPDTRGVEGTARIVKLLEDATKDDLVLVVLSGGASALLTRPAPELTLEDLRRTTDLLLGAGAPIEEVNTVRKHLSAIKGGLLARLAYPSRVLTLVLSDVIGDDLSTIASGPTVPDETSFADARDVLVRRRLLDSVPAPVAGRIEAGCRGEREDTPGPADPIFATCSTFVVGSNRQALDACGASARDRGYAVWTVTSRLQGEAREAARVIAAVGLEVQDGLSDLQPPACILWGGETTVTLRGEGRGGRNQELALSAALDLEGREGIVLLSAGTDGTDGPTDAAGACALGDTCARAREKGLDPRAFLARNDSYAFFDRLGDLVRTGPTGTNVMDLAIMLVERRDERGGR